MRAIRARQIATHVLTIEQRSDFDQLGLIRLPHAISESDVEQMCGSLWEALAERHNIERDAPSTWTAGRASGIQAPARSALFASMGSPAVRAALDDLFGPDAWQEPAHWGQPLVTFQEAEKRWDVPHASWHLDAPALNAAKLPGVVVFAFLAPVLEGGGGTVAVAGSHRLVREIAAHAGPGDEGRSADVRRALGRREPWLRALFSRDGTADRVKRFMTNGTVIRGVRVHVIEMTGETGDVIIWHPWLLHAAALNSRSTPRLMLRQPINPRNWPLK